MSRIPVSHKNRIRGEERQRKRSDLNLSKNNTSELLALDQKFLLADTTLGNRIDAIQTGAGLETDGTYSADPTTNYLTGATSLKNADKLLDTQVKLNAENIGEAATEESLTALTLRVTDTEDETGINATQITSLQTEQTTQNTNISANATAISNNTTNISANTTDIANNTTSLLDEVALRPLFDNVADLISSSPVRGLVVSTRRYYTNEAPVPNMDFIILSPADYGVVPDGYVDFYVASGDVAKNISNVLTSSMGGMRSDGADYTANLQALAAQLNPKRSLYIDSTSFSLSGFVLFNKGFKEVSHASNCVVTFLGAGESSSTTKALYSINVDVNGTSTNETVLTTTAAVTNKGGNSFSVINASAFQEGDAIRINKHVCIITDIFGNIVYTDRTLPIRQLASGSQVSRLDVPNTNSRMEGPSLIKFAPNRSSQYYGMGVRASYCVGITISNFNSLYNASGVAELVCCADSYLSGIYQKSPTAAGTNGLAYAGQLSDGNDNTAQYLKSHEGRHCASISFSHRNKVMDCIDFQGTNASYLTQHNGCRENTFIRCDLVNCSYGVYLGGQVAGAGAEEDLTDGDQSNIIQDSKFTNSRGLYHMTRKNKAVNCQFINDVVSSFREVFVPRTGGGSTFTIENCEIEIVNAICDVSVEFTLNMRGGSYSNTNIDTLFKGTVISNNIANIVFQNDPTSSELPFEGSLF